MCIPYSNEAVFSHAAGQWRIRTRRGAVPRGLKGGHRHGSIFLPRREVDTCRQKSHHPWQSVYGVEVDLDGRLWCGQRRRREGGGSRMVSVPEQAGRGSVGGLDKIFIALA